MLYDAVVLVKQRGTGPFLAQISLGVAIVSRSDDDHELA